MDYYDNFLEDIRRTVVTEVTANNDGSFEVNCGLIGFTFTTVPNPGFTPRPGWTVRIHGDIDYPRAIYCGRRKIRSIPITEYARVALQNDREYFETIITEPSHTAHKR